MRNLFRAVALLLVALWLPATLHCGLEMVGVIGASWNCHAATPASSSEDGCASDACGIVESGAYVPAASFVKAPPPAVAVLVAAGFLEAHDADPGTGLLSEGVEAPLELKCRWHFASRAAPRSRAPSLAS